MTCVISFCEYLCRCWNIHQFYFAWINDNRPIRIMVRLTLSIHNVIDVSHLRGIAIIKLSFFIEVSYR